MMRQMLLLRTHGERETMMRCVDGGFFNVVDQCGHVRHAKMRHAEPENKNEKQNEEDKMYRRMQKQNAETEKRRRGTTVHKKRRKAEMSLPPKRYTYQNGPTTA